MNDVSAVLYAIVAEIDFYYNEILVVTNSDKSKANVNVFRIALLSVCSSAAILHCGF